MYVHLDTNQFPSDLGAENSQPMYSQLYCTVVFPFGTQHRWRWWWWWGPPTASNRVEPWRRKARWQTRCVWTSDGKKWAVPDGENGERGTGSAGSRGGNAHRHRLLGGREPVHFSGRRALVIHPAPADSSPYSPRSVFILFEIIIVVYFTLLLLLAARKKRPIPFYTTTVARVSIELYIVRPRATPYVRCRDH